MSRCGVSEALRSAARKAKSEIRKGGGRSRRNGGAMIPPLRNGKRRHRYGRDDNIERGPTRQKAARKRKIGPLRLRSGQAG